MLKCFWLGLPLLQDGKRSVKLETRKAMALLAYLSMSPQGGSREALATMFWPDFDQAHASANLRRTLSALMADLPSGTLEADRETICWGRSADRWVDVEEFHRAVKKVNSHCAGELCEECMKSLEQTAGLYRGEFLESLNLKDSPEFDEWQTRQRQGYQQLYGDLLARLAENLSRIGRTDAALEAARRWVALDRLHEPAQRCLLRLLLQSGQRSEARRQYDDFSRVLREQVGQAPDAETQSLYKQIEGTTVQQKETVSPSGSSVSFPLLKTKLYIPTPPARQVKRSRLLELLDRAREKALTVISAPAGFGKTTLLAEWIAHSSMPVAWLSLDHGDNDPYRFLSYLILALESVQEGIGSEAQQIMQSPQLVPSHIILASLINDLGSVAEPYVLVLDDYQFITEHAVHDAMSYLLDHIPANLHLVLSTRADPPLQLGRLRAYDQMLELRSIDLRFSSEETAEFLNEVMRLGLSADDVETLEKRTDGWVVGLKMAALSLKGHENAPEFIRVFSGSNRYVMDYLIEEVLRRQPAHIQTFLLETSILEKLSGPLCDSLMTDEWRKTGESGQAVLEYLEKSNLFVIPLDENKQWYRYHHLFADLLRSRLHQFSSEGTSVLHVKASSWFEEQGYFYEAVEHALCSKDYHRSARLLDRSSQTSVLVNALILQKWIQQIPDEILRDHPWIYISQAWIWLAAGKLEKIEEVLELAEACIRAEDDQSIGDTEKKDIRSHIAMLRAYLAFFRGKPQITIEQAAIALQNVRPSNDFLRSRIALQLGESHSVIGDLEQGKRYLHEAVALSTKANDYSVTTVACFRLGTALLIQGRLDDAEKIYQQNLLILKEMGDLDSPMRGKPETGLGEVLRERGQLDAARALLTIGHKHSEIQGQPYDFIHSYICLAQLFQAEGRIEQAIELLSQAETLFNSYTIPPVVRRTFECYRVNLWLKSGKVGLAEQWVAENNLDCHTEVSYATEPKLITLARVCIVQGRYNDAQELLERLASAAETGGRYGRLIEILALRALGLQASGRRVDALDVLAKGLALAEPEGYMRIFLDEGEPMLDLLKSLRTLKLAPKLRNYVNRLLEASIPA